MPDSHSASLQLAAWRLTSGEMSPPNESCSSRNCPICCSRATTQAARLGQLAAANVHARLAFGAGRLPCALPVHCLLEKAKGCIMLLQSLLLLPVSSSCMRFCLHLAAVAFISHGSSLAAMALPVCRPCVMCSRKTPSCCRHALVFAAPSGFPGRQLYMRPLPEELKKAEKAAIAFLGPLHGNLCRSSFLSCSGRGCRYCWQPGGVRWAPMQP